MGWTVAAFFIELHNYPESGPPVNRYDTKFIPFARESARGDLNRRLECGLPGLRRLCRLPLQSPFWGLGRIQ